MKLNVTLTNPEFPSVRLAADTNALSLWHDSTENCFSCGLVLVGEEVPNWLVRCPVTLSARVILPLQLVFYSRLFCHSLHQSSACVTDVPTRDIGSRTPRKESSSSESSVIVNCVS